MHPRKQPYRLHRFISLAPQRGQILLSIHLFFHASISALRFWIRFSVGMLTSSISAMRSFPAPRSARIAIFTGTSRMVREMVHDLGPLFGNQGFPTSRANTPALQAAFHIFYADSRSIFYGINQIQSVCCHGLFTALRI